MKQYEIMFAYIILSMQTLTHMHDWVGWYLLCKHEITHWVCNII